MKSSATADAPGTSGSEAMEPTVEATEHMKSELRLNAAMKEVRQREQNAHDMLADTLRMAADRFADIADIIDEKGPYADAHFLRASAERCRAAIDVAKEIFEKPLTL